MRHDAFMYVIFGVVTKLWFLYHNLKHDQHYGEPRWTPTLVSGTHICQLSRN